ncbi:Ent-pimara-8(14),15-diene synthase [Dichanthelium oligosanthes]|uniref:Ent-pimara-8(14),15-diene synthase n=1 Tax=Dichanthelium oligosanthes TaxID=888268 RepID=A0A1E5WE05_9POAL|nr:Ent-pimara-8(14),15-diene synthase [Dichanthelium oligosanthes]
MLPEEVILENIGSWSAKLLRQQMCSNKKLSRLSVDPAEVEYALKFPSYATLERLEHKWSIEHFKTQRFQMLKSAYCSPPRANEDILSLAADGFSSSQAVYQQELEHLKSWVKEVRLDELEFVKVMPLPVLFSAAATMFPSELSEARVAWSKNSILVTAVDDLFDVVGSREEMENFVALIDKWEAHQEVGFCSEVVEILFRAVYDTSNEIGAKAAEVQNRSVINHISELWAHTARALMSEAEWRMSGNLPSSMEEYMVAGEPSIGLGPIVLPSLYLVGPELPEDVVRGTEYGEMSRHMNICGRLLNDLRTYAKESGEGTINSVPLVADLRYGGRSGASSIEAAKRELSRTIEASRRELLRLVVRDGGAVPWPCRQLFWDMCKVLHLFYLEEDGYASPKEMMHAANAVILQPLQVPQPFGAADE